ncbi:MAG: GerMN domain-containing protein [Actinomycetota bacterium]
MKSLRWAVSGLALAVISAACGNGQPPRQATPAPTDLPSPGGGETTTVTIYYLIESETRMWLAPERHEVPDQAGIGRAALQELIAGDAQDQDHFTPLPPDTEILDLTIEDGLATVDWSADVLEASVGAEGESLGIQSVVWTLTEFPTVDQVQFTVEGKSEGEASNGRVIEDWWGHVGLGDQPFTRAESFEVLEPITIWTPLDGDEVGTEFTVEGAACTFEANVPIRIFNEAGDHVQTEVTTALSACPDRGEFTLEIVIEDPPSSPEVWGIEAYESSADTGEDTFVQSRRIIVG